LSFPLEYRWEGRTFEYHRAQIRGALGYREPAAAEAEVLAGWLRRHWLARERNPDRLKEAATARCRELRIEPPAPDRMDRLVHSAAAGFEERFCLELMESLPERARQGLEGLLLAAAPDARAGFQPPTSWKEIRTWRPCGAGVKPS
jgi:hypothetical protein